MNQRHAEFFGPDLARGPFAPHRLDAAGLQIATALAQLRAPLARSDEDLLAHGDFIRRLADRLVPDYAAFLGLDVAPEVGNAIQATFRTALDETSLLDCWLADTVGGGHTVAAPTSISFQAGTVLQTVVANKHYRVLTAPAGIVIPTVSYAGTRTWYWAVSRHGRVFYSPGLEFA